MVGQENLAVGWNFDLEILNAKVSKLETKFKDLSYEIGLRKSVQQQLQRKMGELDQQAKECSSTDV